jgi:hypothetical protein
MFEENTCATRPLGEGPGLVLELRVLDADIIATSDLPWSQRIRAVSQANMNGYNFGCIIHFVDIKLP